MYDYLFVWERASEKFPERYWIESDSAKKPPEAAELNGAVPAEKKEEFLTELRARFPEPEYQVAAMSATDWATVVDNYPGINNEY